MLQDALKAIRLNDQEVIKLLKDHGFNFDEKVYKLAKETASEIYTTPTTLKEKAEKTSSFDNDVKVNPVTEHHKELLPEVSEQPHNE